MSSSAGFQDISDPALLRHKLFVTLESALQRLDHDTEEDEKNNVHISLLTYIQLILQIKALEAEIRDDAFASVGPCATWEDVVGLKKELNFADWAYEEVTDELKENLASVNYTLLHHDTTDEVGYPSHYIAINSEEKIALVGVKGSSSFDDLLTDICAQSVKYTLDRPFVRNGKTEMMCHEGILSSAVKLANMLEPWVRDLFLPSGFKVLVSGHSLGAGTACLVVPIVRSRIVELQEKEDQMRAVAFASPPVMDHDSAVACEPWTRTIVNNSDFIPRCSLESLQVLLICLTNIQQIMKEKNSKWDATWSFVRRLASGQTAAGEMIMTSEEARDMIKSAEKEVNSHAPTSLYVPGRVLVMYENWKDNDVRDMRDIGEEPKVVESSVTNGKALILRLIEIDKRMISDHFTSSYHESVDALVAPFNEKKHDDCCRVM